MPANASPDLTGFAQVQAQLTVPNQTSVVDLDKMLVFKEASFKENVLTGLSEYTITYATTSLDFVEKAFKACELSGTPRIRFRYGYGSATNMRWLSWQEGIVKLATSMPFNVGQNAGHNVILSIGNSLYTVARSNKTLIRKGLISDIVSQIAADNKLQAVIERTQNQFFYIQSFQDDVEFIISRLQPRAANANGHGNYLFYVRDNVLHFHTPDYQGTYREFNYYQSPHTHMGQNSVGQMLFAKGVAGTQVIAYDPYTGQTRELTSDASKALKLADTLPQFSAVNQGQRRILYHLSENRPEESVNLGQNLYERARMETFKVTLTLESVFDIRAGDFLNLVVNPTTSQTSTWSGIYLVLETVYLVKGGGISAIITVTRGETSAAIGQLTAQAPNQQLVPETDAPGHRINLRDLQDSEKTKGAVEKTSTTTFASVVNPNTAAGN